MHRAHSVVSPVWTPEKCVHEYALTVKESDFMFRRGMKRGQTGREMTCLSKRRTGYLPMQKLEKILPSRSSELNAPVISPIDC